jgi:integrase/recombinase XerD
MSVTLRKRKNADGTTSLRLDIYKDGKHIIETLKHLQQSKPSNLHDRESNKSLMQQAEAIRLSRAVELEGKNYNMDNEAAKKTLVTIWMQNYIDGYAKKDKRNMQGVLKRFITFLAIERQSDLTFGNINALLIEDFVDYLQEYSTGEGAKSYFNRFKKMLKNAFRKGMMQINVLDLVERTATGNAKKKDTLTLDELKILAATPIENKEIRRAALFCSLTGLAWVDVKQLTWDKIRLDTRQLEIVRAKLKKENTTVTVPLNDTAMKLLNKVEAATKKVFVLPTANGANKTLKAWVRRAGINKVVTWHNLRHSYGTNLIFNDVDILTTSKLLGHSSTDQTMRYVKAADEMKQKGTDKLNFDL